MSSPHGLINDNKEYLRVASPEKVPELLAPGFTAKRMQCRHCIRFRSPPFQRRNRVGDAGQGHRPTVRSNHRRSSLTVGRRAITAPPASRPADGNRRQAGAARAPSDGYQAILATDIVISRPKNRAAEIGIALTREFPARTGLRNQRWAKQTPCRQGSHPGGADGSWHGRGIGWGLGLPRLWRTCDARIDETNVASCG